MLPVSGLIARCTNAEMKRASLEAMRMSQTSASDMPAPAAAPLTAAMIGLGQFESASNSTPK